jgi:hypothetical protein
VDLSLHKLTKSQRKRLKKVTLFGFSDEWQELLMDVNKPGELRNSFAWAQSTAT